ncbi:hypothetical protein S2M10_29250 [Sphingomonas sp. S2M10]|uniref:hypothetical protein n=1 Tax=Sphingomonas sp. S2M10 TaxID=2705010 RepID=UPI00145733E4|nr:hypothetical protein [Sphingomonas sp. S2M10]NLS27923.1 hypothetical protein [Sphingomonas sp. S2M10]
MATVHITLGTVTARAGNDAPLSIFDSAEQSAQTMDSTGASAPSTLIGAKGQVWSVTALDAIWVKFGENPSAASNTGHLVGPGQTRSWKVMKDGEKVAIKAAS